MVIWNWKEYTEYQMNNDDFDYNRPKWHGISKKRLDTASFVRKQKIFPKFWLLKRISKLVFVVSLIIFVVLLFVKLPLPTEDNVISQIKEFPPVQSRVEKEKFDVVLEDYEYEIEPLYSYDLFGLVVSDYDTDSFLDTKHDEDPGNVKDICVVWGENIKNGVYKNMKYKSGEFTCFVSYDSEAEKKFDSNEFSNNHLIPANDGIYKKIKGSTIGDQVFLKGYLVKYSVRKGGKVLYTRGTSTTRDDTGNDACEVIYVTDFRVLKKSLINTKYIHTFSGYLAFLSGLLIIVLAVVF